ncbi:1-deoxy-D-xylulose-5-phosphate reductoisomerase [Rhodohalobacter sulfatireducens]|uniref:1-deoxy-D-xylulose 5-phosphate reductoisomerase n=1 Tax=Rhodohalobacter sulfatireducens TaxID=2911366 RepID=A0ABS9KG47_9BACT|nr:1-deoxy-D-xylulose-5-phosphate reductoisomerase [Rhodohalobacter sulfatireducens]MCG2589785.1 1-deoxy-D-xylulose-5-phosphate reductoisomerase [Rhodohalobacter sulfatireducens]
MSDKKIAIFGSTGSIGTQALEILQNRKNLFDVDVLTANNNYEDLAEQVNTFHPSCVVLANQEHKKEFQELLNYTPEYLAFGQSALEEVAENHDYDLLLNSLVGFAGFMSTYTALKRRKKVALANKESLVVGGEIITNLPAFKEGYLVPIDSEHSAMMQCIEGESMESIQKIIITASGGPFRDYSAEQMKSITVEDALNHPNWDMGAKITVDSSTMMNKGLEIIEAHWLFNIPVEKIEPVVHPQSIIHSIVEFVDGSSKAQLGPPDMKVPIIYALTYPEREPYPNKTLDYSERMELEIRPVNFELFPCLRLAMNAAKEGGAAPAVLNAANEIAIERFLSKEIHYIDIPKIIESSLQNISTDKELTPDTLMSIDEETRNYANTLLK